MTSGIHEFPFRLSKRCGSEGANHARLPAKIEGCGPNQAKFQQECRCALAAGERFVDFGTRKLANCLGHGAIAEIGVGGEFVCGDADDGGMAGEVDGVGDDCRGGVGGGSTVGKDGYGVGDAEGKTAAAPPAGGDSADWIGGFEGGHSEQRRAVGAVEHPDNEFLLGLEVECDVSTVVYISARQFRGGNHGLQDFFGYRSGHGGHGSHEVARSEGQDGGGHAASNRALGPRGFGDALPAQEWKFGAEFVEHGKEAIGGCPVRNLDFGWRAPGFHDQVDGTIVEMKAPAIRQHSNLCALVQKCSDRLNAACPQRLKPKSYLASAARLKACPDTTQISKWPPLLCGPSLTPSVRDDAPVGKSRIQSFPVRRPELLFIAILDFSHVFSTSYLRAARDYPFWRSSDADSRSRRRLSLTGGRWQRARP